MATVRTPVKKTAPKKAPAATSLKAQVAKLQADLQLMAWLYAETKAKHSAIIVQLVMKDPQVQQQMQQELLRRMD